MKKKDTEAVHLLSVFSLVCLLMTAVLLRAQERL